MTTRINSRVKLVRVVGISLAELIPVQPADASPVHVQVTVNGIVIAAGECPGATLVDGGVEYVVPVREPPSEAQQWLDRNRPLGDARVK